MGECYADAIDRSGEEKEMNISLCYANTRIKYDDFIENPDILNLEKR